MELWTVRTGHDLGTIQEGTTQSIPLPVQNNPTLTLISGSLPGGLRIEDNKLLGTPFEVARAETSSPIYGMPILNVDKARTVMVNKRSMNAGFAGIQNELFGYDNTIMIFGDAKDMLNKLLSDLKEL